MTQAQILALAYLNVLLRKRSRVSSTVKIKSEILEKRLSLAGMARGLKTKAQSEDAIRVMLSQMVHGHRFYPALAKRVERKYGLTLTRQPATESSRSKAA